MSRLPDGLLPMVWSAPGFWTTWRRRELERRWPELPDRERMILRRRCQGATLAGIGAEIGLSPSRVQQLQARAIRRLRIGLVP
jgi:RNA polymerase sigma factor (sigma-70 family)